MTTIVDPSGTPAPVYNKSGLTIGTITPTGVSQGAAAPITAYASHTVLVAYNAMGGGYAVLLPSTAEIGDVVEIHGQGNQTFDVYPESGSSIDNGSANTPLSGLGAGYTPYHVMLRKITTTNWYVISRIS